MGLPTKAFRNPPQAATLCAFLILSLITVLSAFAEDSFPVQASIRYARGFTIDYYEHYKIVTVLNPWKKAEMTFQYVLVQRGTPAPAQCETTLCVEVPVQSFVTMSTSYLAQIERLGVLNSLVGHDNFNHVNSPAVLALIEAGKLVETGSGPTVNVELLMELNPELIMTHGCGSMYDAHPKLLEAGLPVVINAEYMESTPLARSEWIKFIAAFFNRERRAERLFDSMAEVYETMAARAGNVAEKPTVFVNVPFNGNWWIPGGKRYVAAFLQDAGAAYLWADNPSTASRILDFEAVYGRAAEADYWLNPGQWRSLNEGLAADERFAQFKAFQSGNVYNNNARVNAHGGNDYWESGLTRPDIVLADLIKIFHPALVPDHELVYYQQLE